MPARSTSSIAASSAARSSATGFSQKAGSPARAASWIIGTWVGVGVAITSASTPAGEQIVGRRGHRDAQLAGQRARCAASASHTVTEATPGSDEQRAYVKGRRCARRR